MISGSGDSDGRDCREYKNALLIGRAIFAPRFFTLEPSTLLKSFKQRCSNNCKSALPEVRSSDRIWQSPKLIIDMDKSDPLAFKVAVKSVAYRFYCKHEDGVAGQSFSRALL